MTDPATNGETLDVIVDMDLCDCHGQCEVAAPNVFALDDDGELRYESHPPALERANIEQAIRVCPVEAIKLGP